VLALLVAAVAVACGGGSGNSGGATTPPPASGSGRLVFSRPDAIIELDIATGESREILREEASNSFLLDPAVSPDGALLAYVSQPPAEIIDGRYDAGTDLWVANRDGSGARIVYEHSQPNALVRYPRWTRDGDIVAIIQEIEETEELTRVAYTVQRIDIETGSRTRLLDDAYAITLSPDGSTLAYARPLREGGEAFEAIELGGTGEAAVLVGGEANLLPFNSPEYSPDGASIAFAAADQRLAPAPPSGRLAIADTEAGVLIASGGDGAEATRRAAVLDGLPQDIWLVDARGGQPRLLAALQEDLPSLTWSGDGERIYVLGAGGLYEIEVASGAVVRIGEGVFHGQIDWVP
jgi:Tol biopolymer transport system component